ncbi:hypothetical protein [Psychroserpens luteolus]|uniref:hypothetical protein n=1 Tax=Psychroserpens luteolus TaxID=2855840 RepID=UPI001E5D6289|nr:hypothetical protein [Psychroserpens luteolus]MCD2258442.1 hypothetical protein [Psychroserpens luteolus]
MQTTSNNELSCSVFGHNLERSSLISKDNHELTCKTCHSKVMIGDHGEFNALPYKNRDINTTMRQLFLLKNRRFHHPISA